VLATKDPSSSAASRSIGILAHCRCLKQLNLEMTRFGDHGVRRFAARADGTACLLTLAGKATVIAVAGTE
jgi:hypothetical protein